MDTNKDLPTFQPSDVDTEQQRVLFFLLLVAQEDIDKRKRQR
jgi:hypothetical protein